MGTTYEGWSNEATWAYWLWLSNDRPALDLAMRLARKFDGASLTPLADALRDSSERALGPIDCRKLSATMAVVGLHSVDWLEIATELHIQVVDEQGVE